MTTLNFTTSACQSCRCCRYYQPEGRRGGVCEQLSVPVRGSWKACSLGTSPFAPAWERIEGIWKDDPLGIKESLAVNCSRIPSEQDPPEEKNLLVAEALKATVVLI